MMVPMFGVGRGSGISGPGITITRESDVRMGYLASVLLIASVLSFCVSVLFFGCDVYVATPILAIPFLATGIISYIIGRRWIILIPAIAMAVVAYLFDPRISLLVIYLLICTGGIVVITGIVQRFLFYRVLSSIVRRDSGNGPGLPDRIVPFVLDIPDCVDVRRLTLDTDVRRNGIPWDDVVRTVVLSLVPCAFLWFFMFLDPAFRSDTEGLHMFALTVILYIAALVMPSTILSTLGVRIGSDIRDHRISDGLVGAVVRVLIPLLVALVFVGVLVSVNGAILYHVLISLVMVAVIITLVSVMYYTRCEASVVRDIVSKWSVFHPADIDSGYGEPSKKVGNDFPGTPVRDPRSCFGRNGDQKY